MEQNLTAIEITKTMESLGLNEAEPDENALLNESTNSEAVQVPSVSNSSRILPECGSTKEASAQRKTSLQESQVSGNDTVPTTKDKIQKLPTYKVVRRISINEESSDFSMDFEEYVTEYVFNAGEELQANVTYEENRIVKDIVVNSPIRCRNEYNFVRRASFGENYSM